MSYAGDHIVFDADSHLMELPDFLERHADAKTKAMLPDLGTALTGAFDAEAYAGREQHDPAYAEELAALGDNLTRGPKWHDALGAFNGVRSSFHHSAHG